MEQFEFRKKAINYWSDLQLILNEGISIGLDLKPLLDKVESIKEALESGVVKIVLLGSTSDGKTTAIAGLLGRLEDSMKIDEDESSDELEIYRPDGLKKGFEIVDTPGLFGTKEKEVDGKNIRFSEITERYISEAHVLVYVCDAVTPLKESHVEIIRRMMRTYKKLDSTIFVLNKMDEAGYDLTDEDDFSRGVAIKKKALVERLRTEINLTPDEEKKLNVVCIAANPKNKGLQYWFDNSDDYLHRSRIDHLRNCIDSVIEKSDIGKLQLSASKSSVKDVVLSIGEAIDAVYEPIEKSLEIINEQVGDLNTDIIMARKELSDRRIEMKDSLLNLQAGTTSDIKHATFESMGDVIDKQIGEESGQMTFYMFNHKIDSILSACGQSNVATIYNVGVKMENTFQAQDNMLKDAMKKGANQLKNVKISGEQVKAARDVVAKSFKFKPWGAINLAKNLTKAVGWIGAGIPVIIDVVDFIKKRKQEKELIELKKTLTEEVQKRIHEALKLFDTDEKYYENFAPSFIELCNQLSSRNQDIENLNKRVKSLEVYKTRINNWAVEDAVFEEL